MFENVDGRTTDAGVTGILIAHLGAFGSGELKIRKISKVTDYAALRSLHKRNVNFIILILLCNCIIDSPNYL